MERANLRRDVVIVALAVAVVAVYGAAARPRRVLPSAITVEQGTIREDRPGSPSIALAFPIVHGLRDRGAEVAVNGEIRKLVDAELADFRRIVEDPEDGLPAAETADDPSVRSELTIEYHVTLLTPEVVSVRLDQYSFTGGAHGIEIAIPFVYDLRAQRRIRLGDLFASGVRFRETIAEIAVNDLTSQITGEEKVSTLDEDTRAWIMEGASPAEEHYDQRFTMDREAITVYYDPYQVGAYVWGIREVRIPYERLVDMIPHGGVVDRVRSTR